MDAIETAPTAAAGHEITTLSFSAGASENMSPMILK
jgi:hypothetical protein